ncbi:MAG: homocysteine S-methyltransferase family protein [Bryobacterales bacterium]|nr:homocysteine S-methyltransferase family protein [Bryobacterales bacterium]
MTAEELSETTAQRPLIFEGAFDQNIAAFAEFSDVVELFALTRPEAVRRSHDRFLDAGADVIQTFSWGLGSMLEDSEDREQMIFEAAKRAAEIAREATQTRRGWVAGIVHPGGTTQFGQQAAGQLQSNAQRITAGLVAGGADFLVAALAECTADMRSLMAGIGRANRTGLPVLATYDWNPYGLLSGEDLDAVMTVAEELGAFSTGVYVTTHLDCVPDAPFSSRTRPTHVLADAGYATTVDDRVIGSLAPAEYGPAVAAQARRLRLRFVGGGWAVTPEHIRSLRAEISPTTG